MKTLYGLTILLLVLSGPKCQKKAANSEVAEQLAQLPGLHYPLTVKRFYQNNQFKPVWVESNTKPQKTWEAMLLLDCVLQFGLLHDDYHPDKLPYSQLREILSDTTRVRKKDKAIFEVYLTDAIITFINDLHFGKANPSLSRSTIDLGGNQGFEAETILSNALASKNLMEAVLDVQPKSQVYIDLQKYMTLIRGQYLDDCYTVPEKEARRVAVNMEREKWNQVTAETSIEVNIPSYTLIFHLPDTAFAFNIAVGKKEKPTPLLKSTITYINTAPDWKVPQDIFVNDVLPKALKDIGYLESAHYTIYDRAGIIVPINKRTLHLIKRDPGSFTARQSAGCELTLGRIVFHFPNHYDIYLHDGQQKDLFSKQERALTNGCISIDDVERLASLVLKYDGQEALIGELLKSAENYKSKNFILKKPLPLLISYRTCEIKAGLPVVYPDPYGKDIGLEKQLYNIDKLINSK